MCIRDSLLSLKYYQAIQFGRHYEVEEYEEEPDLEEEEESPDYLFGQRKMCIRDRYSEWY